MKPTRIKDFKFSTEENEIEKKIFESRTNKFDIFEDKNNFILYNIENIAQREPNLNDNQIKKEILQLVFQKNKFDYNKDLLEKIANKNFDNNDFLKMGNENIKTEKLNSIKDNNKFDIAAVEVLYSLPIDSFTLVNDEENNIYLAKIKKFDIEKFDNNSDEFKNYIDKQNSNKKNSLLKSYDLFLNEKYDVIINQKTIERVKNFFQ